MDHHIFTWRSRSKASSTSDYLAALSSGETDRFPVPGCLMLQYGAPGNSCAIGYVSVIADSPRASHTPHTPAVVCAVSCIHGPLRPSRPQMSGLATPDDEEDLLRGAFLLSGLVETKEGSGVYRTVPNRAPTRTEMRESSRGARASRSSGSSSEEPS